MSRCIIIAPLYQGEERKWITPQKGDLLICADAGYRAAREFGLTPDVTIGDFDSLGCEPEDGGVIRLPVYKDDTDMVVCIREGRARGYSEFIAAGCLGGRFDHTLACLQCAADCAIRGERLWLCDPLNRVTVLAPGEYDLPMEEGRKLSILAFTPEVKGVCLTGTLWTLKDAELKANYPLGCSNEWTAPTARLSFSDGLVVVCTSRDKNTNDSCKKC